MTSTDPAGRLREAATKIRNTAKAATPGPWRDHDTHLGQYGHTATVLSGSGNTTELRAWLPSMEQEPWDERRNVWADAAWIALVHPGVGEALAAWLDAEADRLCATAHPGWHDVVAAPPALAVADAILGPEVTL